MYITISALKSNRFIILYMILLASLLLSSCSDIKPNEEQNALLSTDGEVLIQIAGADCPIDEIAQIPSEPENKYIIKEDDMLLGNNNAKVVVIEYFSPTCPHCVYFHQKILPILKEKYIDNNKIAYISREFISNKQDLDATILARCSGTLKEYSNFIEVLLAQQSKWAFNKNYRDILTNIGMLGGITAEKFADCLKDEKLIKSLMENTKLISAEEHFLGTPAFIINGKFHLKSYSIEELSNAIDKLLKE
ncbi:MAG: DsbA family protein [Rickettsiaceae bacterium]|nr:DsbA family protein [Rickettsiaceae bacterium]